MDDAPVSDGDDGPRLPATTLVVFLAGAALYATGVLAAGLGPLMELMTSVANGFGFGLLILVASAVAMREIFSPHRPEPLVSGVWVAVLALGFSAANAVVFVGALVTDLMLVFDDAYLFPVVVVAPVAALLVGLAVDATRASVGVPRLLGLAVWLGCVSLGHLWVVGLLGLSV